MLRGKLEFESGEEGRETEHLVHLLRRAVAETAKDRFAGLDLRPLVDTVVDGHLVATGERVPGTEVLEALPELPILHEVAARLDVRRPTAPAGSPPRSSWRWSRCTCAASWRRTPTDGTTVYGP